MSGALPLRRALLLAAAVPVLLPLGWLIAAWWTPQSAGWAHLRAYVLPQAALETAQLALSTAFGCALLGASLGWLIARCRFPGHSWLQWALLLPAALPTYVLAFAYVGMSEFAAPIPSWLRSQGLSMPSVQGVWGASFVLTLAFYPYVYLLARQHFEREPASVLEAARIMGLSRWQRLWRIRLPLAWPAIALGTSIAVMETLAEFGAVATLGVNTLTTTVYKAWYGMYNLPLAAQLSSLVVLGMLLLVLLESGLRRARRASDRGRIDPPRRLQGIAMLLVPLACGLLLLLALLAPVAQLLYWSLAAGATQWWPTLLAAAHTVLLCAGAAVLITLLGAALALGERRRSEDRWLAPLAALAAAGYAMPGTLLAVALLLLLLPLEQATGWVLSSGVAALLLAYTARFLRVGYSPFAARLTQLSPNASEAARSMGWSRWQRGRWLYLGWLGRSGWFALLLLTTEVAKELPATLILRPLEWDTLAIRIWSYTSEGLWAQAAVPALILVALSVLPAAWLLRAQRQEPMAS